MFKHAYYSAYHKDFSMSVFRYILQYPDKKILQKHEVDAFLAQAVSGQLMDVDAVQNMKV